MYSLGEAVLTRTHNLCFEQKYEKYQSFYLKTFSFSVVKFSIYLNRRVFVMLYEIPHETGAKVCEVSLSTVL